MWDSEVKYSLVRTCLCGECTPTFPAYRWLRRVVETSISSSSLSAAASSSSTPSSDGGWRSGSARALFAAVASGVWLASESVCETSAASTTCWPRVWDHRPQPPLTAGLANAGGPRRTPRAS